MLFNRLCHGALAKTSPYLHIQSSSFLHFHQTVSGVSRQLPKAYQGHSFYPTFSLLRSKACPSCKKNGPFLNFKRIFMSSSLRLSGNTMQNGAKNVKSHKSSDVKRLIGLARPEKWKLSGAMLCLLVTSGVSLSVPYFIGKIIDIIYSESSKGEEMLKTLKSFCLALSVIFVIGGLANFGRVYILQTSSQRIVKRLREQLFNRVLRQEMAFFDKTKTGELINRLSTDTSLVAQSLSQNISDGLRSTFQAVTGLGMMAYVSTKLTLISMGIVPPVAVASIIYGRYLRKITKQVQDSLAGATQVAEERISNIRTVRAFAKEHKESEDYKQSIDTVLQLSYKEALARGIFWGFTGFSGNAIIISVFYFGGVMMLESNISMGDLSSFILYAAYVGISLGGLTSFYTELNRGIAASGRIWQLIDRQPALVEKESQALQKMEGNFAFKNLAFSYPSRPDSEIFSDLSLQIPAGQITAVVGPSGSGKSTLGSLMLRFYDPTAGSITLDGYDIRQLDSSWLRSKIGTVSQEPILFSTTIAENIAYGADNPSTVTMEQIQDAAQRANAYNFINGFPSGFDTLVGERGQMLSGGQRQRIAIARAILKNPKILILDEATSALDAESEYLVQDALETLMSGRTVLTIAHRLSTIMSADNIVVIDEGKVVESGTYLDLLSLEEGLFKKLVERQTYVK